MAFIYSFKYCHNFHIDPILPRGIKQMKQAAFLLRILWFINIEALFTYSCRSSCKKTQKCFMLCHRQLNLHTCKKALTLKAF